MADAAMPPVLMMLRRVRLTFKSWVSLLILMFPHFIGTDDRTSYQHL